MQLESVFQNLWLDYISFNPRAKRIYDLILSREQLANANLTSLANDHIALRTFNVGKIGLRPVAALFEKHGYVQSGEYMFRDKKLFAWHLEHRDPSYPKVFVSELETEKCSPLVQKVAAEVEAAISNDQAQREDLLWSRRSWPASHATYAEMLRESEYAAWVYAFGFRSNHFTISVNDLRAFSGLRQLNEFVKAKGYALNQAGGEIKGTAAEYLEQSSTLAEVTKLEFSDGEYEIPSCYYEFALRHPMSDGKLYQGFVAQSADKIFESTNVKQS